MSRVAPELLERIFKSKAEWRKEQSRLSIEEKIGILITLQRRRRAARGDGFIWSEDD